MYEEWSLLPPAIAVEAVVAFVGGAEVVVMVDSFRFKVLLNVADEAAAVAAIVAGTRGIGEVAFGSGVELSCICFTLSFVFASVEVLVVVRGGAAAGAFADNATSFGVTAATFTCSPDSVPPEGVRALFAALDAACSSVSCVTDVAALLLLLVAGGCFILGSTVAAAEPVSLLP